MIGIHESDKNLREINSKLKSRIKDFERLSKKNMIDYDLLINDLQGFKDDCDLYSETSTENNEKFQKKANEVTCLIEKYKKEKVKTCCDNADALLERIRKIHW